MRAFAALALAAIALAGCLQQLDPRNGGAERDTPTLTVRAAPDDLQPLVADDAAGTADVDEVGAAPEPKKVRVADTAEAAADPEPAPTALRLSPEARACTNDGGRWARAGEVGFLCYRTPRDANKRCQRGSDCAGACLARSGTCAPVIPLIGCHDILTDNGTRATQCKEF